MNSITTTTVAVIIWIFALFLLTKMLTRHLEQKKVDWKQFYVFAILAAVSVITILMIIYATSPSIDLFTRGSTAEFGQFGDMVGGILNPIFGFITVMLLLRSLSVQHNDLEHNKLLRNLESLTNLLNEHSRLFNEKMDAEALLDDEGRYSYRSAFINLSVDFSQDRSIETIKKADAIVESFEAGSPNNFINYHITDIISSSNIVISTYCHLIDLEEFRYIKAVYASRLLQFTHQANYYRLISHEGQSKIASMYSEYLNYKGNN